MPAQAKARGADADADADADSSARPSMPAPGREQQQQPLDHQPQLSAWSLRLSPAAEREFWASHGPQLRQIDGAAFVMSSMNLYTAAKFTHQLHATPNAAVVLRVLCYVFVLASLAQQACIRWRPAAYLRHRHAVVLATRLIRGGWMLAFYALCAEADQLRFVAERIAVGAPPARIVLQLLAAATLVFLGQCLYWPLPFAWAVPVQAAYLGSCFAAMRSWKCVLGSRPLLPGTRQLCDWLVLVFECVFASFSQLPLGEASALPGGSGEEVYDGRAPELLLYCWLLTLGFCLPLHIIWVREAASKHAFVEQQHEQQRQQHAAAAAAAGECQSLEVLLQLPRLWLHGAACVLGFVLSLWVAHALVTLTRAPACPAGL